MSTVDSEVSTVDSEVSTVDSEVSTVDSEVSFQMTSFLFSFFLSSFLLFWRKILMYTVILIIERSAEYHLCEKTLDRKKCLFVCFWGVAEDTANHIATHCVLSVL